MVNKCSPIKLSMVLYCCGGLFDPAPALPGQNGDCSQLMDPATTPNYQQAAGTLQCSAGRGTETGENVYFNFLSGRNSVDESTVCLSLALPPAFQILNSHCTLHSQSAFCFTAWWWSNKYKYAHAFCTAAAASVYSRDAIQSCRG